MVRHGSPPPVLPFPRVSFQPTGQSQLISPSTAIRLTSLQSPFLRPRCSPLCFFPPKSLSASCNVFILSGVNTYSQFHLAHVFAHPGPCQSSSAQPGSCMLPNGGVTCIQIRGEHVSRRNKLIRSSEQATVCNAGGDTALERQLLIS